MSNLALFMIIEIIVLTVPAFFIFKSVDEYFGCLFSFLFSGYFVFWKKLWDMHFNRSMKFTGYLAIVLIASWTSIKIFL